MEKNKNENEELVEENDKAEEKDDSPSPLELKEKELEALTDKYLRTAAEYDNYRKRTSKELIERGADSVAKTIGEILPVLDNLDRAVSTESTDENYKKGVELIKDSFLQILGQLGVEEIKSTGEVFDPTVHQAVQQIPSEEHESGIIIDTFQKGYRLGERIIRFSVVIVAE